MWAFRGLLRGFLHQNKKLPSHIKGISHVFTHCLSIEMIFQRVRVISIQNPKVQFFLGHPVHHGYVTLVWCYMDWNSQKCLEVLIIGAN